ncbi:Sporulation protein YdcC [compost metagenome]
MQHNLDTAAQNTQGTMLEVDETGALVETSAEETSGNNQEQGGDVTVKTEGSEGAAEGWESSKSLPALSDPFGVIIPTYLPDGVVYKDDKVVDDSERSLVLLRYDGTYQFTLSESRSPDRTASLVAGELVDLGFTVGLLTGEQLQTLTWTIDGLEFRITSDNLPLNEMVKIAASMQDQTGK